MEFDKERFDEHAAIFLFFFSFQAFAVILSKATAVSLSSAGVQAALLKMSINGRRG